MATRSHIPGASSAGGTAEHVRSEHSPRGGAAALPEHLPNASSPVLGAAEPELPACTRTPMGQPLYSSLGIQAVGGYDEWLTGDPVAMPEPVTSQR